MVHRLEAYHELIQFANPTPLGYYFKVVAEYKKHLDMDKLGSFASLACAIHCLFVGIALSSLSVLGLGFLASPISEFIFFATAILIGSFAIIGGFRRHHSIYPGLIFFAGILILIIAHGRLGKDHTTLETILSVAGGLTLVTFHFFNRRLIPNK